MPGNDYPQLPKLPLCSYSTLDADCNAEFTCHVTGCNKNMLQEKHYYRKFGVCEEHMKSSHIVVEGVLSRFCQQCGKFHDLNCFDGTKRSCRETLQKHSSRRASHKRPHAATEGKALLSDQSSNKSEGENNLSLRPKGLCLSNSPPSSKFATPSSSPVQPTHQTATPASTQSDTTLQALPTAQPALSSSDTSQQRKRKESSSHPNMAHISQSKISKHGLPIYAAQLPAAASGNLFLSSIPSADPPQITPLSTDEVDMPNKRARRISENASFSSLLPSAEWVMSLGGEEGSQAASEQPLAQPLQHEPQQSQPSGSYSNSELPRHVSDILSQLSAADRQQLIQWLSDKTLNDLNGGSQDKPNSMMEGDQSADSQPCPSGSASGISAGNSGTPPRTSPFQLSFSALPDSHPPPVNQTLPKASHSNSMEHLSTPAIPRNRRLSASAMAALNSLGAHTLGHHLFSGVLPDMPYGCSKPGCHSCGPGSGTINGPHAQPHTMWNMPRAGFGSHSLPPLNPMLLQQLDGYGAQQVSDQSGCGYGCVCSSDHCTSHPLFGGNDMGAVALSQAMGHPVATNSLLNQQGYVSESHIHGHVIQSGPMQAALSAGFPMPALVDGRKTSSGSCCSCSSCSTNPRPGLTPGMRPCWEAERGEAGTCASSHANLAQWRLPQADAEFLASLRPMLAPHSEDCGAKQGRATPWSALDTEVGSAGAMRNSSPFQLSHNSLHMPLPALNDCPMPQHNMHMCHAPVPALQGGNGSAFGGEGSHARSVNEPQGFAIQRYLANLLQSHSNLNNPLPPELFMDQEGFDPSNAMLGLAAMMGVSGPDLMK